MDAALVGALARASSPQLFDLILKRPSASRALLESIAARKTRVEDLGPANVARLRTHPDKAVATRATAVFETLMPVTKAKGELITKLLPAIAQPGGDAARGKQLFTGTCASCHRLGDVGQSALGPPLTGMGTHGRAELLAQILDPNREVDPSYWQWDVTTKKGETLAGVIARENQAGITLRTLGGDVEIKKEEIATRENTRRSMMPEGFEALGAETLRDILAFMEADSRDTGFRVVDLREAYTADSRRGLRVEDERDDTVGLHRFGNVTVAGVPFFLMDPARSPRGTNIVALRAGVAGGTLLDQLPRSVEIPVSATASSLHFLGGVARGAWPTGGDAARGKPVLKVTAHFADGRTEAHVLENGRHFAELGSTGSGAAQPACRRLHAARPAALLRGQPQGQGAALQGRARGDGRRSRARAPSRSRWGPSRPPPRQRAPRPVEPRPLAPRPLARPARRKAARATRRCRKPSRSRGRPARRRC